MATSPSQTDITTTTDAADAATDAIADAATVEKKKRKRAVSIELLDVDCPVEPDHNIQMALLKDLEDKLEEALGGDHALVAALQNAIGFFADGVAQDEVNKRYMKSVFEKVVKEETEEEPKKEPKGEAKGEVALECDEALA